MSPDVVEAIPKMFYFGPWDSAGHYLHYETGACPQNERTATPWSLGELDGGLQPHTCGKPERGESCYRGTCAQQGLAIIHHRNGWTALAFWDSSVDTRSGCCSVYLAQGEFNFQQMVEMAKDRFAYRWNKMTFQVTELKRLADRPVKTDGSEEGK